MTRRVPWIPMLALAAATALTFVVPRSASAVLHAGDVAPDLHKTGLDGQPYTLYQYRGKVVVLFLLGYS